MSHGCKLRSYFYTHRPYLCKQFCSIVSYVIPQLQFPDIHCLGYAFYATRSIWSRYIFC